jgi:SWI/SNF-related matrix-associated actin-dependent regulator of chromatin subfamily A-like protein 1
VKLTEQCPLCNKPLILKDELTIGSETLREYKCGHSFASKPMALAAFKKELNYQSADGTKSAREYQKTGIEFIINSNFNCVLADQMRLGKTPQGLLALKNAYEERTPALILVRSANLYQWIREYKVFADTLPMGIFPIIGSKNWIPPGFSAYIMSMDTFSIAGMVDKLLAMEFKLVIIDEAHSFKNPESNRSQALVDFIRRINHVDYKDETVDNIRKQELVTERKCGVVMLTGTPIKNRADEYFVPLNILAPQRFSSIERYRRDWLIQDHKGKWSRVNPYRLEAFKKEISQYVLRREKEDVYDSLPELNRMFTVITIEDERLKQAYNKVLDRIEVQMDSKDNYTFFDSIGELMLLRQICGMAKVNWTADYAETMLMDSDNSRLAIGIHHHSVRDALAYKLANIGVLKLSGEDTAERKDAIMTRFENSPERILVINMLAGGVGMDFHYCNNVLILERQWNSADEEQFEFRFYNPDKSIKTASTNVEYIIAKGTIDEFFYDMVEEKRAIFGETIANNWSLQTDQDSFKRLIERTVSSRL